MIQRLKKTAFPGLKSTLLALLSVIVIVVLTSVAMLTLNQEELIFFPTKLPANHVFRFNSTFQERYIKTPDGHRLHGLLFKADSSAGIIFYLHGNAGDLDSWGEIASTYTKLNYDIFMLDYRGYGKSEGNISSEQQFHEDVQLAYDHVKKDYPEEKIVVLGYSIGTGTAARLAAFNHPKMLILQSPYYSLIDLARTLGRDDIADRLQPFAVEEELHVEQVRRWLALAQHREVPPTAH